jgi:transposase InsO family protein
VERYRFVLAQEANFGIAAMCGVLRVSRSGYYEWRNERAHVVSTRFDAFDTQVAAAFTASHRRYGSRRLQEELKTLGVVCSRNRVVGAMRRLALQPRAQRRFKVTTDSAHTFDVAPNILDRNFSAASPNQAWVGDITYVWTREGWLYLAVLIDLHSRRVVGWGISEHIDRHLVLDALAMALGTRRPAPGLVHHTDRGSQYASNDYRKALAAAQIVCSMSRKGNCWDNAPAESFFASIKGEELAHNDFATRSQARDAILHYLCWYNAHRRHSTLGNISPAHFETKPQPSILAA